MKIDFINVLGVAALALSVASCAAASEDLSSSSVETEEKTEFLQKAEALPAAYTKEGDEYYPNTPPILLEAEKIFAKVGMPGKRIDEIPDAVKKVVTEHIFLQLNKRLPEFTALKNEKYSDCTNDVTYQGIQKGDIILSITHNDLLMAIDGENVVHHATLCVKTPDSNEDATFITIEGVGARVAHFSLNDIRENDDAAYVMRCKNITSEQIDEIAEFAENQLGKPYNTNFINKEDEESFYCTSLVWQAYRVAGIEIDFNHNEITDYGVVLATDIYKSPNMKLVKYSY